MKAKIPSIHQKKPKLVWITVAGAIVQTRSVVSIANRESRIMKQGGVLVYDFIKGTTTVIVRGLAYTFDIYTAGTDSPIPEEDLEAEQQAEADSHDITKSDFGFNNNKTGE